MNKLAVVELRALISALDGAPLRGISALGIAQRSGQTLNRTLELMRDNPDYFVRVGEQRRYRLNRFGRFRGSATLMQADVETRRFNIARNNWLRRALGPISSQAK